MKISLDLPDSTYFVRSYEPGKLVLNQSPFEHSIAVHKDTLIEDLDINSTDDLTEDKIARLVDQKPDVVVLGTGPKQHFPPRHLLKQLINAQIGVEIMDTHAACRTYNILAQDGRDVMGVFIL